MPRRRALLAAVGAAVAGCSGRSADETTGQTVTSTSRSSQRDERPESGPFTCPGPAGTCQYVRIVRNGHVLIGGLDGLENDQSYLTTLLPTEEAANRLVTDGEADYAALADGTDFDSAVLVVVQVYPLPSSHPFVLDRVERPASDRLRANARLPEVRGFTADSVVQTLLARVPIEPPVPTRLTATLGDRRFTMAETDTRFPPTLDPRPVPTLDPTDVGQGVGIALRDYVAARRYNAVLAQHGEALMALDVRCSTIVDHQPREGGAYVWLRVDEFRHFDDGTTQTNDRTWTYYVGNGRLERYGTRLPYDGYPNPRTHYPRDLVLANRTDRGQTVDLLVRHLAEDHNVVERTYDLPADAVRPLYDLVETGHYLLTVTIGDEEPWFDWDVPDHGHAFVTVTDDGPTARADPPVGVLYATRVDKSADDLGVHDAPDGRFPSAVTTVLDRSQQVGETVQSPPIEAPQFEAVLAALNEFESADYPDRDPGTRGPTWYLHRNGQTAFVVPDLWPSVDRR